MVETGASSQRLSVICVKVPVAIIITDAMHLVATKKLNYTASAMCCSCCKLLQLNKNYKYQIPINGNELLA